MMLVMFLIYRYGSAQCFPDQHSTNWFDGWVSCDPFPNPNDARSTGHWILYDFGKPYALHHTKVWNSNDPNALDNGFKDVVIDYSIDGMTWSELGVYEWEKGTGKSQYEGFQGPDLEGIQARYILLTALSNWGGPCYGLSEIQFEAEDNDITSTADQRHPNDKKPCFSVKLYPNPFNAESRIIIQTTCKDQIGYTVRDVLGKMVIQRSLNPGTGILEIQVDGNILSPGNYIVSIRQNGFVRQYPLIKVD